MRLFAALVLPKPLVNYINQLQHHCQQAQWFKANYPESSHLHVTLLFLGERETSQVENIREKFREAAIGRSAIISQVKRIEPRRDLLWLRLEDPDQSMAELARRLQEYLDHKHPSARLFVPHITLLRIKQQFIAREKLIEELDKLEIYKQPILLNQLGLYHSELHPQGSHYTCLEMIKLMD